MQRLLKSLRSLYAKTLQGRLTAWIRYCRAHPRTNLAIKAAAIFSLFWVACWRKLDPDFGWHLQAGNYFREHGIPSHDVFSYTASNYPWINHEWLSDILVSHLFELGGFVFLSIVFAALWTSSLLVSGWKTRFIVLLLAFEAVLPYASVRPIVWTVLGLAIGVRLLESKNWRHKAWFMLPLTLLWVNLHGGFFLAFGLLGYYTLKYRSRQLAFILALSIVVSFVNPYGVNLYTEIFDTLLDSSVRFRINEWNAFAIFKESWAFVFLWMAGFWLYSRQKKGDWLRLSSFFFASSLSTTRNVPLFVITAMRQLDEYITQTQKIIPKKLDRPRRAIVTGVQLLVVGWLAYLLHGHLLAASWNREEAYPAQAVSYLEQHGCKGSLFNVYRYGGYLVWKLPDTPVYIDGRMAIWHDASGDGYLDKYMAVTKDDAVRRAEFEKYSVGCALISREEQDKQLLNGLRAEGWRGVVNGDDGSVLLVKP